MSKCGMRLPYIIRKVKGSCLKRMRKVVTKLILYNSPRMMDHQLAWCITSQFKNHPQVNIKII